MPTIVLTSGTTFTVPVDCNKATIEAIGAGRSAYSQNNGGAYAKSVDVVLTPGNTVFINIPAGTFGGDTWFNKLTNAAPASAINGVKAAGGDITPTSQSANSVFTVGTGNFFKGGAAGGGYFPCCCSYVFGAGGGGAGPNGAGGNGGFFNSSESVGGGGGANGGGNGQDGNIFVGIGGAGGTSRLGNAGGAGGAGPGLNGSNGTNGSGGGGSSNGRSGDGSLDIVWTDFAGNTYGVGSGAGAARNGTYGNAGGPGAGGNGTLGQGIIIITYGASPAPSATGDLFINLRSFTERRRF